MSGFFTSCKLLPNPAGIPMANLLSQVIHELVFVDVARIIQELHNERISRRIEATPEPFAPRQKTIRQRPYRLAMTHPGHVVFAHPWALQTPDCQLLVAG